MFMPTESVGRILDSTRNQGNGMTELKKKLLQDIQEVNVLWTQ